MKIRDLAKEMFFALQAQAQDGNLYHYGSPIQYIAQESEYCFVIRYDDGCEPRYRYLQNMELLDLLDEMEDFGVY